jgi:flagellar protein FliJ
MKRFRYRLEPLLTYRKHLEHIAQLEVAKASAEVSACSHNIDMLKINYHQNALELEQKMSSGINAENFIVYRSYLNGMENIIDDEIKRHKQLTNILLKKKEMLKEKSIAKKALSNLKTRKKRKYYEDLLKAEQKETDDTIIVRKARDINV